MQFLSLCLILGVAATSVHGAGRAFPMASQRFVEKLFGSYNPRLKWDPTNFLVDLSGRYTSCEHALSGGGEVLTVEEYDENTGAAIGGLFDSTIGYESYVDAVNKYLEDVMPSWLQKSPYREQIANADRFGCSVQPGCQRDIVAIACLFSPRYIVQGEGPVGLQRALAFTQIQYDLAEEVTGMAWDNTETLTAISGYETSCDMIGHPNWLFTKADAMGRERNMRITGQYGSAPNLGDTTSALREIAKTLKPHVGQYVGCSIIPDCIAANGQMYVVASCLYTDEM